MRIFALLFLAGSSQAADLKAGLARVDITPDQSIWMSGYANRNKPSQGVLQRLWAKALALDDGKGKLVIITTDLIGLPRAVSDLVCARIQKQHGLDRSRVLLNSSHTHTGPVVRPNLITMYNLSPEQEKVIQDYTQKLTDSLVSVISLAIADLAPAQLSTGNGKTDFAINRRQFNPNGVSIGTNPQGPMDHDVPVVKIASAAGRLRGVLFGYACHNTTLTGEFYQISGDYAGYAQAALETANPGTTAMYLMLCGGDQNPNPRSTLELAERHGKALGTEVSRVLEGNLTPLRPPIRTAFRLKNSRLRRTLVRPLNMN
jgi:hypothetical protein